MAIQEIAMFFGNVSTTFFKCGPWSFQEHLGDLAKYISTAKRLTVWSPQHWARNPIYVFQEMKLRGLVPISYIHVSMSDLYIPRNVEIGRQNSIPMF